MNEELRRQALVDEINRRFSVLLLRDDDGLPSGIYRDDVTSYRPLDYGSKLTDELRRNIRRWVESQLWQFSRQLVQVPGDESKQVEYAYLAPMSFVRLSVGFHATRRVSLCSIKENGLLPSSPERQNCPERSDCEGNIYVCERLGTPDDAGVQGSESAHWWRGHLAEKDSVKNADWVILQVKVGKLTGVRIYRDIWSKSGIIIDIGNMGNIPWKDHIELVYGAGMGDFGDCSTKRQRDA